MAFQDLVAKLGLDIAGFHKGVNDAIRSSEKLGGSFDATSKQFQRSVDKLAEPLKDLGGRLTIGLTAPLAAVGAASLKMGMDFELGMRRVTSLLGEASSEADKTFSTFSAGILDISKRVGIDATQATNALYEAISAGVPKENAMEFLETASKAAIAGMTNTKVAVDGLTTVLNAYGLSADRTAEVSDAMFQAVNIGKVTFEELASSIGIAAPLASQLGVSFQELLAGMATITKQGLTGSEAFTQMRSAMVAIISPNAQMNALFEKLGVTAGKTLIEAHGLEGALVKLRDAAGGSEQKLADALGRVEALGAALSLTGKNAGAAAADLDGVTNSAGATEGAFREIGKSVSQHWAIVIANIKAAAIELDKTLGPAVSGAIGMLQGLIGSLQGTLKAFQQQPEYIKNAEVAIIGMAASLGPLAYGVGQLISSLPALGTLIGTLVSPLGVAVVAVTSLATAWALASKEQKKFEENLANANEALRIRDQIDALKGGLRDMDDVLRMGADETWPAYIKRLAEFQAELRPTTELARDFQLAIQGGKPIALIEKEQVENVFKAAEGTRALFGDLEAGVDLTARLRAKQMEADAALQEWLRRLKEVPPAYADIGKQSGITFSGVIDHNKRATEAAKDLVEQNEAIAEEWKKWDLEILDEAQKRIEQFDKRFKELGQNFQSMWIELGQAADRADEKWKQSLDTLIDLQEATQKVAQAMQPFRSEVPNSLDGTTRKVVSLHEAMEKMGVATKKAAVDAVEEARQVYLRLAEARQRGDTDYLVTLEHVNEALKKYLEAKKEAGRATEEDLRTLERLNGKMGEHTGKVKETEDAWGKLGNQISTIMTDLSRDLAKSILDSKDLGEAFTKAGQAIKEAMLRTVIEETLKPLQKAVKELLDWLGDTIAGALRGLPGIGGIFGGGGGGRGGGPTAPGVPGGTGAGGVGGAAATGVAGWIGAIGSAASAVSGIIGNFQMRTMGRDLGRIEVTTRETFAELFNLRTDEWTRFLMWMEKVDDIQNTLWFKMELVLDRIDDFRNWVIVKFDTLIDALISKMEMLYEHVDALRGGITVAAGAAGTAIALDYERLARAIANAIRGLIPTAGTPRPIVPVTPRPPPATPVRVPTPVPLRGRPVPPPQLIEPPMEPAAPRFRVPRFIVPSRSRIPTPIAPVIPGRTRGAGEIGTELPPEIRVEDIPNVTASLSRLPGRLRDLDSLGGPLRDIRMAIEANHEDLSELRHHAQTRDFLIRIEGGSARDQEFAEYVIRQVTRQLKEGQLV